jgi:ATP-binding cassette subfamily B protein
MIAPTGRTWVRRLWPYLGKQRRALMVCAALSVVGQVLVGLLPLVQKIILDDAVLQQRRPLVPWLATLLLLGSVGFALHYFRRYLAARISLELQHDLRVAIQRHLHALDFARHDQLSSGDVMSRATGDVTLIQMFVNQLPLLIANVSLLVVALVVMTSLSPPLACVIAVFVPAFLLLSVRYRDLIFPSSFQDQRLAGAVAGVVEEAVSGVRVVKAFGQEQRELALVVARARELFGSRLRTARLTAHYSATLQALPGLAQLGVLVLGGYLALNGRVSLGVFLAFCSYLVQLIAPVRLLSGMLGSSQQARAGAERVLELLDLEPLVRDAADAKHLERCSGAVQLERVSFAFAGGEPVLRDITLDIAPGERLGIVGSSGSGKSTLSLLLARFYDPAAGVVRLDGHDVRELSLDSLRRNVGVVFEDSFLFSSTIRENIAFGRPGASEAEIESAARAASAHDFISALPEGYDTRVGERGLTLSGGQRQRIALARMFLANPRVLVLDDATSAIDAETEESIHAALEAQMKGRTTIVIAHRQSTLRLARRVIVLERGKIVAQGSNEALLATSPLYRTLLAGPELGELDPPAMTRRTELDARAWPEHAAREGAERAASVASAVSFTQLRSMSGGGGGGGHRDLGGNRAAFAHGSAELLERVAKLPPVRDEPDVDEVTLAGAGQSLSLRSLLRYFRLSMLLGLLLVTIDALTSLSAPLLIGGAVDHAIVAASSRKLLIAALLLAVVQLTSWVNARAMQLHTARTAERMLFTLRTRTFAHLQRLSLAYYDRELSGRIMTRMTTDIEAFAQLLQQGLLTAVVSLLSSLGVFGVLLTLNARLCLVAFSVLPFLLLGTAAFRKHSGQAYLRARERIGALYGSLHESLAGVRVTQAFSRRDVSEARFVGLSLSYRDARLRSMQLIAIYFPFLQLLSVLAKAATLGFGATQVASGRVSAGVLIAFLLYLDHFFTPIQQLSMVFDQWIQARVSLTRVRELLSTQTLTPEAVSPRDPGTITGDIRFEGVHFAYAPGLPEALRGVDLHVRPGETVALVGTTGAGKSTFVKLAARFYDPTRGRVLIDGQPLSELHLAAFRSQLGYVPQEPFLFSGSVRSNIAYGRPEATDLEVEQAARNVGAHELIAALPQGYHTPVTASGRSLSQGQRQLLCLARAELVNPAILILDEATSNLDLGTEAEVQRAMRSIARGRTTLLIAHRLQTARAADRIVVVNDGQLVESGNHEELIRTGGRYARLWEAFHRAERSLVPVRATA